MHLSKEINKALVAVIVALDGLNDKEPEIQRYNNSGAPIFNQNELDNLSCEELIFYLRLIGGLYNEPEMRGGSAVSRLTAVTRKLIRPGLSRSLFTNHLSPKMLKLNAITRKGLVVTNKNRLSFSKALQKNSKLHSITTITKKIDAIQQKIKELRLSISSNSNKNTRAPELADLISQLPGIDLLEINQQYMINGL